MGRRSWAGRDSALWFGLWLVLGSGVALGFLGAFTIGIYVLPVALIAVVFLARSHSSGGGFASFLIGLGLPFLSVAWANRDGPADACHAIGGGGTTCIERTSPWPWLGVALLFIAAGSVTAIRICRRR